MIHSSKPFTYVLIMGLLVIIIAYLTWDLQQVEGMHPPLSNEVAALDSGGNSLIGRQVFLEKAKAVASDGAEDDHFGRSIDIDGDTTIVGAPDASVIFPHQGAAYIFTWSGNSWTQQAKLISEDGQFGDGFGQSVAIEGDTVIVGVPSASFTSGEAYVFTRSNDVWTQQSKLTGDDEADRFGSSVAIDGDTIIVGANFSYVDANYAQGAAYVFTRSGSNWTQQAKLTANDGTESDYFGGSVAIDGDTAIVGAHLADVGTSRQGAVYVFTRSGSNWTQQARLTANDGATSDLFGGSTAIYSDTVIVGASQVDVGGMVDAGAAYIFTRSGSNWTQQARLTPTGRDAFGRTVDIEEDTIIVGAPDSQIGCMTYLGGIEGTAHIFTRSNNSWAPQNTLVPRNRMVEPASGFGNKVALSGNMAVIGSSYADVGGNEEQGAAYLYELTYFNESFYLPIMMGTSPFCIPI